MTCDQERPCTRCLKRDIGHLCRDEEVGRDDRVGEEGWAELPRYYDKRALQWSRGREAMEDPGQPYVHNTTNGPEIVQPTPISPNRFSRPSPLIRNDAIQNLDWNNQGVPNQFQDMHHLHPNYMFNTSEATNEYNLLNDFLSSSLIDEGALYGQDDAQALFTDPLLTTSSMNFLSNNMLPLPNASSDVSSNANNDNNNNNNDDKAQQPPNLQIPSEIQGQDISRPSSTFPIDRRARDKFYMTAADPAGSSSAEDRLHKLLKAKYDAGMLKPFNYVKGYARLQQYMSRYLSRESQLRILKQLDRFRPKFREAMESLTDMQLVLVEMWFERSLMEYDRVFASMAIPACCWRRTGEIFRGNREMAELLHVPLDTLRDGRFAIHEIIAEDSLVSYWEKFGAIAFDQSQKAILTSCTLKFPIVKRTSDDAAGGGSGKVAVGATEVMCCFSFTIRRDSHNM